MHPYTPGCSCSQCTAERLRVREQPPPQEPAPALDMEAIRERDQGPMPDGEDQIQWTYHASLALGDRHDLLREMERLQRERDEARSVLDQNTCAECGNHDQQQFKGVRVNHPQDPEEWECECKVCGSWAVFPSLHEAFEHSRSSAESRAAENVDLHCRLEAANAYTGPERRKEQRPWEIPARVGKAINYEDDMVWEIRRHSPDVVLSVREWRRAQGRRREDWRTP